MTDTVYVATWGHKHGNYIRIFKSKQGALNWRTELANDFWDDEMPKDTPRPEDPQAMADEYWGYMCGVCGLEWFSIFEEEVEE